MTYVTKKVLKQLKIKKKLLQNTGSIGWVKLNAKQYIAVDKDFLSCLCVNFRNSSKFSFLFYLPDLCDFFKK